ncbi:hypothetical protein M8J76_003526 [Diaphorina citri]|nr:hypothetical protein M8J75_011854 [Diaphorina citri]KAI5729533.1 hypothetical protein M8J76_003526 [Diaphorina citri]KAI5734246.1 hypothetical protein M8J77_004359 [Diaphorina citri]
MSRPGLPKTLRLNADADDSDYIMDIMRMCAENPMFPTPSTIIHPHGKTAEAVYYIQTTMAEIDPLRKGLSGKDIINHLMEKGNPMDANMKRQIRAELIRGVRHGDFSYVEDEYTRRKYYSKF